MVRLGEVVMILDLHRQGLPVSAIARRTGVDRKTVRKYIQAGLEPPHYGPRRPRPTLLDTHHAYLRERVVTYPDLSARRLLRELRGFGYAGGYSQLTEFLREVRPAASVGFERRFETPPGQQAQVDFAQFRTEFTDEPGAVRIIWLFSMVLGHSRLIWATFVMHQDLQAVLRCHVAAFEAIGGVPVEVLYDRMRTAVTGEGDEGIVYKRHAVGLRPPLRLHAQGLSALPRQEQGQGRAPVPLHPPGLLPRPQLPQPRRPEPAAAPVGSTRTPTRACTPPHGVSSLRISPRSAPASSRCRPGRSSQCCGWSGASPATAWSPSAAIFTACPIAPAGAPSEVHTLTREVHIFEEGRQIAAHPVLEGRGQRRIAGGHRQYPRPSNSATPRQAPPMPLRSGDVVARRPLEIYAAVGQRLADGATT